VYASLATLRWEILGFVFLWRARLFSSHLWVSKNDIRLSEEKWWSNCISQLSQQSQSKSVSVELSLGGLYQSLSRSQSLSVAASLSGLYPSLSRSHSLSVAASLSGLYPSLSRSQSLSVAASLSGLYPSLSRSQSLSVDSQSNSVSVSLSFNINFSTKLWESPSVNHRKIHT
jgi:hypothetical protein